MANRGLSKSAAAQSQREGVVHSELSLETDADLVEALQREAMPRFVTLPRVTGAHLVRNDTSLTGGNAGNQCGRVILLPDIVVMIEASNPDAARAAGERLLSEALLTSWGAAPGAIRGLYQLEYSIQSLAE